MNQLLLGAEWWGEGRWEETDGYEVFLYSVGDVLKPDKSGRCSM